MREWRKFALFRCASKVEKLGFGARKKSESGDGSPGVVGGDAIDTVDLLMVTPYGWTHDELVYGSTHDDTFFVALSLTLFHRSPPSSPLNDFESEFASRVVLRIYRILSLSLRLNLSSTTKRFENKQPTNLKWQSFRCKGKKKWSNGFAVTNDRRNFLLDSFSSSSTLIEKSLGNRKCRVTLWSLDWISIRREICLQALPALMVAVITRQSLFYWI